MTRRRWARDAWGGSVALVLVTAAGCSHGSATSTADEEEPRVCTPAARAMGSRLAELPELDLVAPRTRVWHQPTWECDVGELTAEARFESTSGPAAVLGHYRRVLPARGWTVVPTPEYVRMAGVTCFRRPFEGRTAFLQVEFPWEDGLDTTKYSLEVWAATAFNAEEECWRDD